MSEVDYKSCFKWILLLEVDKEIFLSQVLSVDHKGMLLTGGLAVLTLLYSTVILLV